ncbi:MAG: low temperature requirement protein A [Chloroflexi bacterium]|nr:low temperature requirement protein A [Chloroflexota bacterium]
MATNAHPAPPHPAPASADAEPAHAASHGAAHGAPMEAGGEMPRKITWLELFYDLVYVATFVQLGNHLSADVSVGGFLYFALLFIPIWWSWVGTTIYSNRFDSDDIVHRVLVFTQIFIVAIMAVFSFDALETTAAPFALAYAANRFVLAGMYWRVYHRHDSFQNLTQRYVITFAIVGALWAISAFLPAPLRFVLWAVALAVDFGVPAFSTRLQAQKPLDFEHAAERFALLTIIVFGESFLKVIAGLAGDVSSGELFYTLDRILFTVPPLLVVISLWWLYFDNVAEAHVRPGAWFIRLWLYAHLPFQLAVTALGVGLSKVVGPAPYYIVPDYYRVLFAGSVALLLVMLAVVEWVTEAREGVYKDRIEFTVRLASAAVVFAIGLFGSGMSNSLFTILVLIPCLGQVIFDVLRRTRTRQAAQAAAPAQPAIDSAD